MNFDFSQDSISYDWFILALRLVFIGLIYLFIYQIGKVTIRELVKIGTAVPSSQTPTIHQAALQLEVMDAAESGFHRGDKLPLEHYTTIGRRADNSMVIPDSFVSGQHAEIILENGAWWLDDLGSTNGTFLNGQPLSARTRIEPGDIVQFGRVSTRLTR